MPLNRAVASEQHYSNIRLSIQFASESEKWQTNFVKLKMKRFEPGSSVYKTEDLPMCPHALLLSNLTIF